jgi:hypothetical protein
LKAVHLAALKLALTAMNDRIQQAKRTQRSGY